MSKRYVWLCLVLPILFLLTGGRLWSQDYIGSTACIGCHTGIHPDLVAEYQKTGHPFKLNKVEGAPPSYPDYTSPGVPAPPPGLTWNDLAYVIGGYGWKARFVKKDGRVFTTGDSAQYNLEDGSWVPYSKGQDKKYDYNCFKCHTTGAVPEGSWNGVPEDSLGTFSEPGIRCEGCHGPGSAHAADPQNVKPPYVGDDLTINRCGDCHQRGGTTNIIPAKGGFIRHHEQLNEMRASKHGDGQGADLTCASCHDAHVPLRYPDAAGQGMSGIKANCQTCHPNKEVKINGVAKNIDCVDCHMPMAGKSAIGKQVGNGWRGDVKTHIWAINTDPVSRDSMFTTDGKYVRLDENGLAAVTLDFACLNCHQDKDLTWASTYAKNMHQTDIVAGPQYVGEKTCLSCHTGINPTLVAEYQKTGHPFKLNKVEGGPPTYPENTSPGVPNPPPNTTWDDFAYVIGGYGWKARFVKNDGRVYTIGDSAQYNLADGGWVPYSKGKDKKYDYNCFKCHTTGPSPEGSWNGIAADSLGTFSEPGIRCEGCHGPGSEHVASLGTVKPPLIGDDLRINRCGDCHQRGGTTNAIPASGGYIRHHEQLNEMRASAHGDGQGTDLTCATCHDTHVPLRYADAAGEGMSGIKTTCETCHPNHEILVNGSPKNIDCVDCHMPMAGKSAIGMQVGNGWKGDVKTHIWGININAVTKEAMFTSDGKFVQLDENGHAAVTLDFVCLGCHTQKDVAWAATYTKDIHTNGIVTGLDAVAELPKDFRLMQNYPNPFNPSTTIAFDLPKATRVVLKLYSQNGQLVKTLIDQNMPAGAHKVTLDASSLASGVYLYRIEAGDFVDSKKMLLVK